MAGSTLGCYSKGCTLRYHYLCAMEAGEACLLLNIQAFLRVICVADVFFVSCYKVLVTWYGFISNMMVYNLIENRV